MSDRPAPAVLSNHLSVFYQEDEPVRLSLLVYGKPGVGKTFLAATAQDDPRTAPALYIDVEDGRRSIRFRKGLAMKRMLDYNETMAELDDYFYGPSGFRNPDGYKTLIVDGMTILAQRVMKGIMETPNPKRSNENNPEYGDWNTYTNKLWRFISWLRDLPIHVIVTALEESADGSILPLMQGQKIPPLLPAYFDTVGWLSVVPVVSGKETMYVQRLLLSSEVRYMAKDRYSFRGLLPREMDDPTVSRLMDRIELGEQLMLKHQTEQRVPTDDNR